MSGFLPVGKSTSVNSEVDVKDWESSVAENWEEADVPCKRYTHNVNIHHEHTEVYLAGDTGFQVTFWQK